MNLYVPLVKELQSDRQDPYGSQLIREVEGSTIVNINSCFTIGHRWCDRKATPSKRDVTWKTIAYLAK